MNDLLPGFILLMKCLVNEPKTSTLLTGEAQIVEVLPWRVNPHP